MDTLERIVTLEAKLAATIDKLDTLVDTVAERYEGDSKTPGIVSRIIQLEEFKRGLWWSLGVLYTAVMGIIATLLARKL